MVAGGTGSGKSNVSANLIDRALKFGKCVLLHDAKPDYGLVNQANTDSNVTAIWQLFQQYGLQPHPANNLRRVGFYGACNPDSVDVVVGFHASDFSPEMLAGLFFTGTNEQLQFEGFADAADALREQIRNSDRPCYSLDDIMRLVERRMNAELTPEPRDQLNNLTATAILRKVGNLRIVFGHALVNMYESKATVLAQMAPSPFELMRNDNTGSNANNTQPALANVGYEIDF